MQDVFLSYSVRLIQRRDVPTLAVIRRLTRLQPWFAGVCLAHFGSLWECVGGGKARIKRRSLSYRGQIV